MVQGMATPPTRPALTRTRVLRAALDLVDREGVDALTMRRLGRELGVEAMSLYGYVDSKEDLVEGVVELIFGQMPLSCPGPALAGPHPAACGHLPHGAADHPNAVRLVAGRPLVTEGTAAFVDSALAELPRDRSRRRDGRSGAGRDRQLHAGPRGGAGRRGAAHVATGRVLDLSRFPDLAEIEKLGTMTPARYDAEFELGLDFIVAGVEGLLRIMPPREREAEPRAAPRMWRRRRRLAGAFGGRPHTGGARTRSPAGSTHSRTRKPPRPAGSSSASASLTRLRAARAARSPTWARSRPLGAALGDQFVDAPSTQPVGLAPIDGAVVSRSPAGRPPPRR